MQNEKRKSNEEIFKIHFS